MKKNKIIGILMSVIMVLGIVQLPSITVLAQEPEQTQKTQELPSRWAIPDVNMCYYLDLVDANDLHDYKKPISLDNFCKIAVNTYEEINNTEVTANLEDEVNNYDKAKQVGLLAGFENVDKEQQLTKKDVVVLMYNIIKSINEDAIEKTENIDLEENAVNFFVDNKLVQGNTKGELLLDSVITRQETYVLAKRVLDFTLRSLGKYSKGMFYKVTGGKNQLYVLGSIHVADKETYPLSKSIEDAFKDTDCLVEEVDFTKQNDTIYMMQKGMYTDDDNLKNHISEEVYNKYIEKLKQFNLESKIDQFTKFKPWYAAFIVTNLNASTESMIAQLGIDIYLMNKCIYQNKDLEELEGIRFQTDLFDEMDIELQEQFLAANLVENDKEGTNLNAQATKNLLVAWKNGDAEQLTKLVTIPEEESAQSEFNTKLLDERNVNMVKKIKEYLNDDTGRNYMVVIGAAHLYNESGILKGLTDAGYEVEQILE